MLVVAVIAVVVAVLVVAVIAVVVAVLVVAVIYVDAQYFLCYSDSTCPREDTGIAIFWLRCVA